MKVNITAESKRILAVCEIPAAKEIVRQCKEDELTVAEYAEIAIRAIGTGCEKVYEARAEIAKNCRVWDAFGAGTGTLDVWITATAKTWDGFVEIGACLTDIWNISGEDSQTQHMFIQKFIRAN